MKHSIIQTDNYLLVVDESEIKEGDFPKFTFLNIDGFSEILAHYEPIRENGYLGKKIISHLPLNNSPILEGVDLLPKLEEKYDFAEMFYGILKATYPDFDEWVEAKEYNKAKEKYKYTEEDLRKAIDMARNGKKIVKSREGVELTFSLTEDEIIQSLQQPKYPVGFECEMEVITIGGFVDGIDEAITIDKKNAPKTTTNSQGQTQWVGKYIW